MLLNVPHANLVFALSKIQSIVEKRASMPILEHVKIEIENGTISLTTTDMDLTATAFFALPSNVSHSFTTVAQPLYDITRKLYNCDDVQFNLDKVNSGSVQLLTNNSDFVLPCLPSESFPSFDKIESESKLSLPASVLMFLLDKSKHAMCTSEIRYYLNGVYVHVADSKLKAAATDIHRLAKISVDLPENLPHSIPGVIIPRKSVLELCRILESCKSEDTVDIEIAKHKIKFSLPGITITSKIIDASFPNYSGVVQKGNVSSAIIKTKELAKAIDLVTTVSESKMKSVRMNINANELSLSVDNQVSRSGMQKIAIESSQDSNYEVLLNSKYILDALSAINTDQTKISFSDSEYDPITLQGVNEESAVYVLMPMQIKN